MPCLLWHFEIEYNCTLATEICFFYSMVRQPFRQLLSLVSRQLLYIRRHRSLPMIKITRSKFVGLDGKFYLNSLIFISSLADKLMTMHSREISLALLKSGVSSLVGQHASLNLYTVKSVGTSHSYLIYARPLIEEKSPIQNFSYIGHS